MGGGFESFGAYVLADSKNWKLRMAKLTPPDNPFALREKVLAHPTWAVIQECSSKESPFGTSPAGEKDILDAIRDGVTTAFVSSDKRSWTETEEGYQKLGCRWDSSRNCYVRGDGTMLGSELIPYPSVSHEFTGIPRLKVEVRTTRTEAGRVSIRCLCSESGSELIPAAALVVMDEATKKQVAWLRLTGHEEIDSTNMEEFFKRTVEEFLAFPPHKPFGGQSSTGTDFNLAFGAKVKLVVLTNGQRYESPILAP